MNLVKSFIITILAAVSGIVASSAIAYPPHLPDLITYGNRWTITFYDDSSPVHQQWATQGLCFYAIGTSGTHQRYIWISDTYPDWNGRATQEGDQIFMHGDFQWPWGNKDGGHDGMTWEITTLKEGSGHWHEWVEGSSFGTTIGFGNTKLVRVGNCLKPGFDTVDKALQANLQLEIPKDEQGRLLSNPMGIQEATTNQIK